jgi:hypothetical protein
VWVCVCVGVCVCVCLCACVCVCVCVCVCACVCVCVCGQMHWSRASTIIRLELVVVGGCGFSNGCGGGDSCGWRWRRLVRQLWCNPRPARSGYGCGCGCGCACGCGCDGGDSCGFGWWVQHTSSSCAQPTQSPSHRTLRVGLQSHQHGAGLCTRRPEPVTRCAVDVSDGVRMKLSLTCSWIGMCAYEGKAMSTH